MKCNKCFQIAPNDCPYMKRGRVSSETGTLFWCPNCNWDLTTRDRGFEYRVKYYKIECEEFGVGQGDMCIDCPIFARYLTGRLA